MTQRDVGSPSYQHFASGAPGVNLLEHPSRGKYAKKIAPVIG